MTKYYMNKHTGAIAYILVKQGPVFTLVDVTTNECANWKNDLFHEHWELMGEEEQVIESLEKVVDILKQEKEAQEEE